MKFPNFFSPITLAASLLVASLGVAVMVGWHAHLPLLIQIHPDFVPMRYNTALCFLLLGTGWVASVAGRQWLALGCGLLVGILAALTGAQSVFEMDLGIDQRFMQHHIAVLTDHPGRMAPNTALSFVLCGVALAIAAGMRNRWWCWVVVGLLGMIVFIVGLLALMTYLVDLEGSAGWFNQTPMALHTAAGFVTLSLGMLAQTWQYVRLDTITIEERKAFQPLATRHSDTLSRLSTNPLRHYLHNASFRRKSRDLTLMLLLSYLIVQASALLNLRGLDAIYATEKKHDEINAALSMLQADIQQTSALSYWYFLNVGDTVVATARDTRGNNGVQQIGRTVNQKIDSMLATVTNMEPLACCRPNMQVLSEQVVTLKNTFFHLDHLIIEIGVNESVGTQGAMRTHAHQMEGWLKDHKTDAVLRASLLELRRREKDFLMRGDPKSLELAITQQHALKAELKQSGLPAPLLWDLEEELVRYTARFNELADMKERVDREIRSFVALIREMDERMSLIVRAFDKERLQYGVEFRGLMLLYTFGAAIVVTCVLFLTGLLVRLVFLSVLRPIELLKGHADRITQGDYETKITLLGHDEIGELATHLHAMKETMHQHTLHLEETIRRRTDHLETTNQVLEETIEQLNRVHGQLIQSEKLASLGRLVAGFAHEINTPIGVGLTAISSMPAIVLELEQMLTQDEIDEDELDRCLAHLRNGAALGLANMRRATELVTRFKRTSVDQASESARRFNVQETLNDIALTLHNTFKNSPITMEWDGPADLVVLSQPGLLGQVVTNLLMNSFKHGFDNGTRAGTIHVRFALEGSPPALHFWYRDNGKGIAEEHIEQLFEPFFTTARESGGSGLGTYIVYNIITGPLKGAIQVSSRPGEGVLFHFYFPIEVTGSTP